MRGAHRPGPRSRRHPREWALPAANSGEQRGGGEVVASGFLARVTPDQPGAPVLPCLICSRQVKRTQSLQGLSCWCPQGSLCPRLLVRLLCHHSIHQGLWGRW